MKKVEEVQILRASELLVKESARSLTPGENEELESLRRSLAPRTMAEILMLGKELLEGSDPTFRD